MSLQKSNKSLQVVIISISRETTILKDVEADSFDKEYLSFDISVKLVDNVDEAIKHINEHSSKHTECIITEDKAIAEKF